MDTQLELLTKKWDGILQTIRQENDLSNVAFKTWLLPLKVFRIEDHENSMRIRKRRNAVQLHRQQHSDRSSEAS